MERNQHLNEINSQASMAASPQQAALPSVKPPSRSGCWVVAVLLTFAILMTGTMWLYWKAHIGPFVPLQKKLANKWKDAQPRVEGGQRKMHKASPKILRVTMKIDFDPKSKSGTVRAGEFSREVADFVADVYPELADYEILELHFYWPEPEKEIQQVQISFRVSDLR